MSAEEEAAARAGLAHPDAEVRLEAVGRIADLFLDALCPDLAGAAFDSDARVRLASLRALGTLLTLRDGESEAPDVAPGVRALVETLEPSRPEVERRAAIQGLLGYGEAGVSLVLALPSDHPDAAWAACRIGESGYAGADRLATLAERPLAWENAVRAIGCLGAGALPALPTLVRLLARPERKRVVLGAFANLGRVLGALPMAEDLAAQVAWAAQGEPYLEGHAARALVAMGQPAAPELIGWLDRGSLAQRRAVACALAEAWDEGLRAVADAALQDEDPGVREQAARSFAAFKG